MPRPTPNLAGERFGKLTAVYRIKSEEVAGIGKHAMWMCKCDCGIPYRMDKRLTENLFGSFSYGNDNSFFRMVHRHISPISKRVM